MTSTAIAVSRVLLHCAPRRFLINQFVTGSIKSLSGAMASKARALARPQAAARVADELDKLVNKPRTGGRA